MASGEGGLSAESSAEGDGLSVVDEEVGEDLSVDQVKAGRTLEVDGVGPHAATQFPPYERLHRRQLRGPLQALKEGLVSGRAEL